MKIEDLRENLLDFESKIQGTLKEIPKDVRSYNNNSNFNASSSRYRVLEAEQDSLGILCLTSDIDRVDFPVNLKSFLDKQHESQNLNPTSRQ